MRKISTLILIFLSLFSMAAPPTVPASNFTFYQIDGNYFNIGFTGGNGARRIVVAREGSEPTFVPQNGIDYTANGTFGQGTAVAPGEYVVYKSASSSFYIEGLKPATQYYFRVYEFNGTGSTTEYLTASFLSGNGTTATKPTLQTSNAGFSNITANSLMITWTNGNGQRRLIVAKEGVPVNAEPEDSKSYGGASYLFGNGTSLGDGNYAVYASNGTYTTVSNLKPGTTYHFAFFEYNGSSASQFLTPGYTASATTRSAPTVAASGMSITKTDGKELIMDWTKGNGQRRVVIAKKASEVTSVPADGTDYTANKNFGQGQQIATGEYVVYDDNGSSATVSELDPGTAYFFKVFEYDGTGSSTIYLTSSFAAVSGSTATNPTVQAQVQSPSNITASSMRLFLTPGNGRARLVIGRSAAAVNVNPVDLTLYTDHNYFGSGQDLGNGNYVLAYTTTPELTVQNLQPNTTYHFAVYELNGFNQPLYLTPAVTTSATTSGTLPVKLTSWSAVAADGKVNLQWKTGLEVNASHFVVERSSNGNDFSPCILVNATGNSTVENTYQAVDEKPLPGKSFYRLKMVDTDGVWEYAAIRVVLAAGSETVKILANPVQSRLQVVSSAQQRAEWRIVNVTGQVVKRGMLSKGHNDIDVSVLAHGQYWFQAEGQPQAKGLSFIKQ